MVEQYDRCRKREHYSIECIQLLIIVESTQLVLCPYLAISEVDKLER